MESQDVPEPPTQESRGGSSTAFTWLKSLRRSSTERILTGVAGGLAQKLGVPTLLVRAAFVLAAFAGFGIPLYLVLWVLVPTDTGRQLTDGGRFRDLVAIGIIVLAGLMLTREVAGFSTGELFWRSLPWGLMLVGLALILRRDESVQVSDALPGAARPADQAAQQPLGAPLESLSETETRLFPDAARARPSLLRPRRPAVPVLGILTWCAVLVICASLGAAALAGVVHFGPGVVAAVALIVFGLGLVFSAFRGRARGLILPCLVLAGVLGSLAAIDVRVDNVDPSFNLKVVDPAELPSKLRASVGESSLDMADLQLTSDRYLRIDQTAGELVVLLPIDVAVELKSTVGVGEVSVNRPSREVAVMMDQDLARDWFDNGTPEAGDPVDPELYRRNPAGGTGLLDGWWGSASHRETGLNLNDNRAFNKRGRFTLQLDVNMGAGSVRIIDPHWSNEAMSKLTRPSQLCTVGGGQRGVVKPCGEVPADRRVALCINEALNLVDCREDRPATQDYPRIPACRDFHGQEVDCADIGIDPVGAELFSPVGPDGDGDQTSGGSDSSPPTIKMPDRAETTVLDGQGG